jgi:hypothetical protein
MDIKFQTVGPERQPAIERGECVLGRQRAAPAVREDKRT